MTSTMSSVAALVGIALRSEKKSGKPIAAAEPKHTACLFVKPSINFVFTRVKSLGIET
jgi:hypothetical protein